MEAGRFDELLRFDVGAEVVNVEAVDPQQHGYHTLADLMDIPLTAPDDHAGLEKSAVPFFMHLRDQHIFLHLLDRDSCFHQFRKKNIQPHKGIAHFAHQRIDHLSHYFGRGHSALQTLPRESGSGVSVSAADDLSQCADAVTVCHDLMPCGSCR